jgi:uncharacterized membrane protein
VVTGRTGAGRRAGYSRRVRQQSPDEPPRKVAGVVVRNIRALLELERDRERRRGAGERVADAVSRFAGSMPFVYVHLLLYGGWIVINLGLTPVPRFDPTFVVLAMIASVEAIFISTFVLITQNRMAATAARRAELDLQISLLAEHEVTRILSLLTAIGARMGVDQARDPELADLAHDVAPERLADTIQAVDDATERGLPPPELR